MAQAASEERTEENVVKEVLDIFQVSYEYAREYMSDFNKQAQLYDQVIDPETWETSSEVTLGQAFAMCQNMIAPIMYYTLWSPEVPFEMIPRDPEVSYATSRKVRENIVYTQRERMNLEWEGQYTLLDILKFGIGYTMVESKPVQGPGFGNRFAAAGTTTESLPSLEVGEITDITTCRHIGVGRVWPTPDGSEPDNTSVTTVLDFIDEFSLRQMYARPDNPYRGDVEKIIEYARTNKLNGWTASAREIADYLARQKQSVINRMNKRGNKNMPALIPIVKQYRENQHIYVACDKFLMYDVKDKYQTLQCPLVKGTFAPEGGQWFTKGLIGRGFDSISAVETYVNAMIDLLSISLHPHKIINIDAMAEQDIQEDIVPYGTTRGHGPPGNIIDFVKYPQMPAQAFTIPDQIRGFINELVGAGPSAQQAATPGIVRGGTGALESLLQTSSGREKATAKHIENGWYKPITLLTLIYQQILINDKDEYTFMTTLKPGDAREGLKEGDKYFAAASVTTDDIRQDWRVEFNFREKLRNFIAESSHRIQVYDRMIQNRKVNEEEALRYLIGDEYVANRLMSGVASDREQWIKDVQSRGGTGEGLEPQAAGRGTGIAV